MNRTSLAFLVTMLFVCSSAWAQNNSEVRLFPGMRDDPLYDLRTYQRTRDITVSIAWNQAPLRNVLRDLTLAVRKTYPLRSSTNFRFSDSANEAFRTHPITFAASNMPVYQVLENLSQQAGFTIKVHKDLVLVVPVAAR